MKSANIPEGVTRYLSVTTPTVTPSGLSHTQETPNVTALPLVSRTQPANQTPMVGRVAELPESRVIITNPRATIARYRHMTVLEWQQILEQYRTGKGQTRTSSGKAFTRAEVEFITKKYGAVSA